MTNYDDIIRMERPRSAKHPPMPRTTRAKQFMPYATLRGFGDILSDRKDAVEAMINNPPEEEDDWEDANCSV